MPTAAEQYAAMLDAVDEQQLRLFGPRPADIWTGQSAAQFRFDPYRNLDANLAALVSWMSPDDVGGGRGRRCRTAFAAPGPEVPAGAYRRAVGGHGR